MRQALVAAGESKETLPPLPMRTRKRKARDRNAKKYRNVGRGRIPGRVDIGERPKTVENRAHVRNWEGELINGRKGTGNFATLAERMTCFTLFAYVATKEAGAVASVIIVLLASLPPDFLKMLTFDNGKEFAGFAHRTCPHAHMPKCRLTPLSKSAILYSFRKKAPLAQAAQHVLHPVMASGENHRRGFLFLSEWLLTKLGGTWSRHEGEQCVE